MMQKRKKITLQLFLNFSRIFSKVLLTWFLVKDMDLRWSLNRFGECLEFVVWQNSFFTALFTCSPGSLHFAVEMKSQRWAWGAGGWREQREPSWQSGDPVWPPWWCPCWTAWWWPSWPTWQQCPAGLKQRPRPRVPSDSLFHLELFIWKRWQYAAYRAELRSSRKSEWSLSGPKMCSQLAKN